MIWIEMSKDENHGGEDWGFTKCLWSPEYKIVSGKKQHWAYWDCMQSVKAGEIVLHLRGDKNPKFVGYSITETDGFSTIMGPSNPGPHWDYADKFYRVNLEDYQPFEPPIELGELFKNKETELRNYFNNNKRKDKNEKRLLFYVIQNSKLSRQNGAYLSEVDDDLYEILFCDKESEVNDRVREVNTYTTTSEGSGNLTFRKGQSNFSENVRDNFNHVCCYPGCEIADRNFLVGSHIARWADHPEFRGETSNGLCFCLIHDKAFELGLFTLDENLNVSINDKQLDKFHHPILNLYEANGKRIKNSKVPIGIKYIKYHWTRIGYSPKG